MGQVLTEANLTAEPSSRDVLTADERRQAEVAIPSFSRKLDEFAAGLSESEREQLSRLLVRAMGPLDRIRVAGTADLLSDEEKQVLRSLSAISET